MTIISVCSPVLGRTFYLSLYPCHNKRMNNSSIGKIAEMDFAKECIKRGIVPSMPIDDCGGYDFIIEKNGKLVKVQIKSTARDCGNNSYKVCVQKGSRGSVPYKLTDFDILSIYIHPVNVWYHIPSNELKVRGLSLQPNSKKNKYAIYKDWDHIQRLFL